MGKGLIIFWGRRAPSGMAMASSMVSISVTPIASTLSSFLHAYLGILGAGVYEMAWCVVYIDIVDLFALEYGLIGFSETVTTFFGNVGICNVSVLRIVVSPGCFDLSLLVEVLVERW